MNWKTKENHECPRTCQHEKYPERKNTIRAYYYNACLYEMRKEEENKQKEKAQQHEKTRTEIFDSCDPGKAAERQRASSKEGNASSFALTVETVNSSGLAPIKQHLLRTSAKVVLAQEVRAFGEAKDHLSVIWLNQGGALRGDKEKR